jgi:hypothetical protein
VRIGALAAAGACAASLALAASSQAEVMTATWNGFVQNGIDYTGVFGAPGATLTGLTFQAVYTMDDNVPGATRIVTNDSTGSYYQFNGDGRAGAMSASITINGITLTATSAGGIPSKGFVSLGDVNKYVATVAPGVTGYAYQNYVDQLTESGDIQTSTTISMLLASQTRALFDSADYRMPFTWTFQPGDLMSSSVGMNTFHASDPSFYLTNVYLNLAETSLTVTGGGDGSSSTDALLPAGQTPDGGYIFQVPVADGQTVYVDPALATGYDYAVGAGSPLIASATFPTLAGDPNGYDVYALTDLVNPLFSNVLGGTTVDFTSLAGYAGGISGFALRGIDLGAQVDPNDPTSFVTGLTFVGSGTVSLTQTPVTVNVVSATPEPATWAGLTLGMAALGGALRRRRPAQIA